MITVIEHWCLRMWNYLEDSFSWQPPFANLLHQFVALSFFCFSAEFCRNGGGEEQVLARVLKDNERYFGKVCHLCLYGLFRKCRDPFPGTYSQFWETEFWLGNRNVPCPMHVLPTSPSQPFHCLIHPIRLIVLYSLQNNHIIMIDYFIMPHL